MTECVSFFQGWGFGHFLVAVILAFGVHDLLSNLGMRIGRR